jgi:hypothetical protein
MRSILSLRDRARDRLPRKLRRDILNRRHARRLRSSEARALPDFLVIGTQRGGTSSLFRYLSGHPQIVRSLRKETEYFSGRYGEGIDWYRAHFPRRSELAGRNGSRKTFEATPDYMLDPRAAGRAAQLVKEAKIVALLRNPAERAYSHYRHMVRLGFENLEFEAALDAEKPRCEDDWARLAVDDLYRPTSILRFSYAERGHYADQLARWIDRFGEDRVHVVISEKFFADTPRVFGEILEFLELDQWRPDSMPNYSYVPEVSQQIDAPVAERLAEHFRPHNDRLRALLGSDPEWELGAPGRPPEPGETAGWEYKE